MWRCFYTIPHSIRIEKKLLFLKSTRSLCLDIEFFFLNLHNQVHVIKGNVFDYRVKRKTNLAIIIANMVN